LYGGLQSEWSPFSCDDVKIGQDHGVLKLATSEEPTPQEILLEDVFSNLKSKSKNETEVPAEKLTVEFRRGTRVFRVIFDSISFETNSSTPHIDHCLLYLMEK
jgi:hypothetical protein